MTLFTVSASSTTQGFLTSVLPLAQTPRLASILFLSMSLKLFILDLFNLTAPRIKGLKKSSNVFVLKEAAGRLL